MSSKVKVRNPKSSASRVSHLVEPSTPEFDLLAFIAVVSGCERVCVYCGCSDSMGCPEGCEWVLLHPATPTGVCSRCHLEHVKATVAVIGKSPAREDARPAMTAAQHNRHPKGRNG
jgi:hypothetical protein